MVVPSAIWRGMPSQWRHQNSGRELRAALSAASSMSVRNGLVLRGLPQSAWVSSGTSWNSAWWVSVMVFLSGGWLFVAGGFRACGEFPTDCGEFPTGLAVGGGGFVVAAQGLSDGAVGCAGVGFDGPPDLPPAAVGRGERGHQLGGGVFGWLPAFYAEVFDVEARH